MTAAPNSVIGRYEGSPEVLSKIKFIIFGTSRDGSCVSMTAASDYVIGREKSITPIYPSPCLFFTIDINDMNWKQSNYLI
jgi:hypothetical protein